MVRVVRRVVVTKDALLTSWGVLCNGKLAFGTWTGVQKAWLINCFELMAVHPVLHCFILYVWTATFSSTQTTQR